MSDDDDIEYGAYFEGSCTCEHEPEDHGWGECGVESECSCGDGNVDMCMCEAGWVE